MLSTVYRNLNKGVRYGLKHGIKASLTDGVSEVRTLAEHQARVRLRGLRRKAKRGLAAGKAAAYSKAMKTAPAALVGEVGRTLDIFRADWDIDFEIRDEDLHKRDEE